MKRTLAYVIALVTLVITHSSRADNTFFNVSAGGVPANLSITLCLNGNSPISCQIYTVSATNLNITTTIPNHTYPTAGIKVNTPGYGLSGCTPISNGYCLFSVSDVLPAAISTNANATINYWVATNGDDTASGDFNHPFLTIQHAQAVIQNNSLRGVNTIYVNIKGGTYRLSNALTFSQNDSGTSNAPVVYRAASGEQPEISGGTQITGWTLHDAGLNIWQAQTTINTSSLPRQLYVNGVRATRARTPQYPNYYTPNATGYDYSYTSGSDPQIPPNWNNPTVVEAVTVTQWKMMRCPVDHLNINTSVVLQAPCITNANYYPYPWNFHLLSWFENAYEFLDTPGEWYLDPVSKILYYIPLAGENIAAADVELPILQTLMQGTNVSNMSFIGLRFRYATWFDPNSANGYVCDQSGFHLNGTSHSVNLTGHDPDAVPTPGNVNFSYAQNIIFSNNIFEHLGAVALYLGTGSQNNQIVNNTFNDISSAGIQLGGISQVDHHPSEPAQLTSNNLISNNLVQYIGQEFYDAAGIYIGFTTHSVVQHNDVLHVPWAGIAIGWGWGLLDPGGFPGLPNATPFLWGTYTTPSAAHMNQIINNNIQYFLEQLWDGGAIYSTGFQGTSITDGQLIAQNVAENKRTLAGGNTFYTDGGSRYITLNQNVSLNNPQGYVDFGPCGKSSSFTDLCPTTNVVHYGTDMGGCVTYGDLIFENNYFGPILTYYNICKNGPIRMSFINNITVSSSAQIPSSILNSAGRQNVSLNLRRGSLNTKKINKL